MDSRRRVVFIGILLCLALSACARDRKYYREETGVLKAKSRAADGVNTGSESQP